MINEEIIKRWVNRSEEDKNKMSKDFAFKGKNLFSFDKQIYSYGTHFCLAVYLGEKEGKKVFLVNADRWTRNRQSATGSQQRELRKQIDKSNSIAAYLSFAALMRMNGSHERIKLEDIYDTTQDYRSEQLLYIVETNKYYELDFGGTCMVAELNAYSDERKRQSLEDIIKESKDYTPPISGAFDEELHQRVWVGEDNKQEILCKTGTWHTAGGLLLVVQSNSWEQIQGKNRYVSYARTLLCSVDEGSYFLSELQRAPHPKTFQQALEELKPDSVRAYEEQRESEPELPPVLRQGEWFFVPILAKRFHEFKYYSDRAYGERYPNGQLIDNIPKDTHMTAEILRSLLEWSTNKWRAQTGSFVLPTQNSESNRHLIQHTFSLYEKNGATNLDALFCFGTVKHVGATNKVQTREHRLLNLGDKLYMAAKNTEVMSVSSNGSSID